MYRIILLTACLILLPTFVAMAEDTATETKSASEAKELSGMSIVGNDEAPKSLYIVPWKSSELGVETSLKMLSNQGDAPVDRVVFQRQMAYYQVSTETPSVPYSLAHRN